VNGFISCAGGFIPAFLPRFMTAERSIRVAAQFQKIGFNLGFFKNLTRHQSCFWYSGYNRLEKLSKKWK
jgi:hypothetical protein